MIKYRTMWHGSDLATITELEVIRETDKQVVLPATRAKGKEVRENKISDWKCWFDTFEQANDFLVSEAQKKVDKLRLHLQQAIESLEKVKADGSR